MAVPKRKTSRSRTKSRRANKNLPKVHLIHCSNCGEKTLPHQVCLKCGHYRGQEILQVEG